MNKRQRKKVINKLIKEKHPRLYYRVKESYRKYGKRHRTGEKINMDVGTMLFIMGSMLFMGYTFGKMEEWKKGD